MTLGQALAIALFLASLLAVVLTPWCEADVVTEPAVWRAMLEQHADALRPGDVLLVHPPWRDDVVKDLRASHALPPRVTVTDVFAPRHGDAWPSVVVLRDVGAAPMPRALRARVLDETRLRAGSLELVRLRPGTDDALDSDDGVDLSRDALATAHVHVDNSDGSIIECPWDAAAQRHVCEGLPEWMHVGVERLPVAGNTVLCTWAHPRDNAALVVDFDVDLGPTLTLDLALTDGAADNKTAALVHALVTVDGKRAIDLDRTPGHRGFASKSAPVVPGRHNVTLAITTPSDGQRHTCFRLVSAL